ncbi:CBN-SRG-41 protein [Caenorhabditis brenneri]|uniref:Serpentine receptor class gamma n=1 Tax=Caenorhabditis brenneri TaxID=135651 RepID=G0PHN1_CAEBE|nr:CBN-SRG-41 protein [Caenorhabditis brenneri]
MVANWVYILLSIIYGLPSIFLYIFSYFIIINYRKSFDSSFFNLYIFDGLFNLFTYLNGFVFFRLNSVTCDTCFLSSFYKNITGIILKFIVAMTRHMAYVQYGTTVLISANRLSVLLKYNVLEPIWRKYTWILIVFIYFLPFLDTHRYFTHNAAMVYSDETEGYNGTTSLPVGDIFYYLLPFMVISTICSLILNVISLLFVKSVKLQTKTKVESNFLIITTITCTAQLFGMILSVSIVILAGTKIAVRLAQILPFASDGLTLLREKMKMILGIRKSNLQAVSSQVLQARSLTS